MNDQAAKFRTVFRGLSSWRGDRKVEIGLREWLVGQREVPPFLVVAFEAILEHDTAQQRAIAQRGRRQRRRVDVGCWVHAVERGAKINAAVAPARRRGAVDLGRA